MGELSLGRPKCGHGRVIEAAAYYWLLNGGWRLNKWSLNAGSTVMVALSMCLLL